MSKLILRVLWLENNLAITINLVVKNTMSPITGYFFWPRIDAWEQIKSDLEFRPWIQETEKIKILNTVTELINYWQEHRKTTSSLADARAKFPDIIFIGNK